MLYCKPKRSEKACGRDNCNLKLALFCYCMARILFVYNFSHPTCALIDHQSRIWAAICCKLPPTLLQPRSFSFSAMSANPSPELKSLFETALKEFEKRAGSNLVQHQIIDKLVNCETADSVIDVLQEQAQAFRDFRGDDGKLMTWFKRTVNVLYTLSTSGVLGEGIGLVCHGVSPSSSMHRVIHFPSAISTGKGNIRWTGYTSWRMCPTWVLERILVTPVPSIRQSRILARATMHLWTFSSLSNPSSGDSTSIQRSHPPLR
jgi:hypothetical protein